MAQKAGTCLLLLLAVGCTVEDDVTEDIDNPLGIACTDSFQVQGTFTAGTPAKPADVGGCWPVGTWSFSASLHPSDEGVRDITGDQLPDRCGKFGGTQPATTESNYAFVVSRTDAGEGWVDSYAMNGTTFGADCSAAGACIFRLKVSEGGGGECEGGLEIYSADRKEHWNFKPNQSTSSTTLTGFGEYTKFTVAQNP